MNDSQQLDPFGRLYGKSLTAEQVAEMKFRLVTYIELLIQLDQQHKEWLAMQSKARTDKQGEPSGTMQNKK